MYTTYLWYCANWSSARSKLPSVTTNFRAACIIMSSSQKYYEQITFLLINLIFPLQWYHLPVVRSYDLVLLWQTVQCIAMIIILHCPRDLSCKLTGIPEYTNCLLLSKYFLHNNITITIYNLIFYCMVTPQVDVTLLNTETH